MTSDKFFVSSTAGDPVACADVSALLKTAGGGRSHGGGNTRRIPDICGLVETHITRMIRGSSAGDAGSDV